MKRLRPPPYHTQPPPTNNDAQGNLFALADEFNKLNNHINIHKMILATRKLHNTLARCENIQAKFHAINNFLINLPAYGLTP